MRYLSLEARFQHRFSLNIVSAARIWAHRIRSRRALAKLEPTRWSDIGLTPMQAQAEVAKPFWKA